MAWSCVPGTLPPPAATGGNDPDWTVGVKLTRDDSWSLHCPWTWCDFAARHMKSRTAIAEAARIDGTSVSIGLPEDPGQAGKTPGQLPRQPHLPAIAFRSRRETGAKATRAAPVASQVEARNFAIVRAGWNHAFLEELRDFPFGRKDDQVDALSRAFTMLTEAGAPARRISVPLLTR